MYRFLVAFAIVAAPKFTLTANIHRNEFLFGGKIVETKDYPFMVSIRVKGLHYCAGTIINDQWILTAAHCLQFPREKFNIVVGSNTLLTGGKSYNVSILVPNGMFIVAKQFILNDIGLMQIDGKLKFDDNVRPIKLCSNNTVPNDGEKVTVVGWGRTQTFGDVSNDLRYLSATLMNAADCMDRDFPLLVLANQICATSPVGQGTCNGDSGGPLIYNGAQYGIVSWGVNCAIGYPDVYTNVCTYVKWINEVLEN